MRMKLLRCRVVLHKFPDPSFNNYVIDEPAKRMNQFDLLITESGIMPIRSRPIVIKKTMLLIINLSYIIDYQIIDKKNIQINNIIYNKTYIFCVSFVGSIINYKQ